MIVGPLMSLSAACAVLAQRHLPVTVDVVEHQIDRGIRLALRVVVGQFRRRREAPRVGACRAQRIGPGSRFGGLGLTARQLLASVEIEPVGAVEARRGRLGGLRRGRGSAVAAGGEHGDAEGGHTGGTEEVHGESLCRPRWGPVNATSVTSVAGGADDVFATRLAGMASKTATRSGTRTSRSKATSPARRGRAPARKARPAASSRANRRAGPSSGIIGRCWSPRG